MKEICAGAAGEELAMDKFWGGKMCFYWCPDRFLVFVVYTAMR